MTKTPANPPTPARRYAIYWAPPADHPLWRAGCEWLGRDAESGAAGAQAAHRVAPRRYGFHATLKPPFGLASEAKASMLVEAIARLARAWSPFEMPALSVATLVDFVALRPQDAIDAAHPLRKLADDCVRHLDLLRRLPTEAEVAHRVDAARALSPAQRTNIDRWGYPHVFDDWRFHMTLTDGLAGDAPRNALLAAARSHFEAALAQPLRCDGVALFVEDAPGADLRLVQRFAFAS